MTPFNRVRILVSASVLALMLAAAPGITTVTDDATAGVALAADPRSMKNKKPNTAEQKQNCYGRQLPVAVDCPTS